MTALLIALALAVWSALCVAAGGWYIHHRYAARLNRLAGYEAQRDARQEIGREWMRANAERARRHTLAVSR